MTAPDCPICLKPSTEYLTDENAYSIYYCKKCHTIFVHPMPTEQTLRNYYQSLFKRVDSEDYELFSRKAHWAAADYIRRNFSPGKALDVGCGYGHFLEQLNGLGWDAKGLDIEPVGKAGDSANIVRGRIEQAPFKDESFNLITLWWVLEHSLNPISVLKQVRSMLIDGGSVLLRVPNMPFIKFASHFKFVEKLDSRGFRNPVSEKKSVFNLLGPPHHLFGFSVQSIERLMKETGFRGLKVLFLEQILTGNQRRDLIDNCLYWFAKSTYPLVGKCLYHDLVILLEG